MMLKTPPMQEDSAENAMAVIVVVRVTMRRQQEPVSGHGRRCAILAPFVAHFC